MAGIKLFGAVQRNFKALGIYAPSQPNQICSLNRKNGFYISAVAGMSISVAGYFFFEANSAYEYSVSFYMMITFIANAAYVTVFFHNMRSFLKLIKNYEEFIDKRKRCFALKF